MGYRHYMYKISKDLVEEIKGLTYEELAQKYHEESESYFHLGNLPKVELHDFGKYCDGANDIYSEGIPLFKNKEVMENLDDYKPFIVGKEGLKKAIEIYKKKVIDYYESLLTDGEHQTATEKQLEHIKDILTEWKCGFAIDIDENKQEVTSSWKFEYSLFELVRLLKTIDFEKDTILFYGW